MSQAQVTLQDYITDTTELLRDNSGRVYSPTDIVRWINMGRRRRDVDLGINRAKYGFNLTQGVYQYTFDTIQQFGTLLAGGPPGFTPIDVTSIIVVPLGFATSQPRYPLGRWPYSRLAFLLATSYPTYPAKYALYGPGTIMLGPPPASTYPTEVDFYGFQPALMDPSDIDPVPYPWTDPVKYYAAYMAKMQNQRFDEAQIYYQSDPRKPKGLYQTCIIDVSARGRPFAVANPWSDLPRY